jgi:hypothetical protein
MNRTTTVLTREDCMDTFWQTVAELTVKYADRLRPQEPARQA